MLMDGSSEEFSSPDVETEWEIWSAATPDLSNITPRALLTALAEITRGVLVAPGAGNYVHSSGWVVGSGWGGDVRPYGVVLAS